MNLLEYGGLIRSQLLRSIGLQLAGYLENFRHAVEQFKQFDETVYELPPNVGTTTIPPNFGLDEDCLRLVLHAAGKLWS